MIGSFNSQSDIVYLHAFEYVIPFLNYQLSNYYKMS